MEAGVICWIVVAVAALIFQCIGGYFLFSNRKKKVIDYLLLHLCFVELALLFWDAAFTIRHKVQGKDPATYLDIYKVGSIALVVGQMLSLILITFDRVLAVKLTIKYRAVVTKRRTLILFPCCWALCMIYGIVIHYSSDFSVFKVVLSTWEIIVVIIIFFGYGYIILVVQSRNRKFAASGQRVQRPNIKLAVPTLVVVTFVLLVLVPDLIITLGVQHNIWFTCSIHLNILTDSLIYIFGSGRIKCRIKNWFCKSEDKKRSVTSH